ncbi:universal stress protein [Winogradskyella sp.]|jgi:nucleotide-binding universal stress UspA family protein|uniref:universal stress protein n=1 Tax=Winogradskyella sp. TaxID=1883156 RepID=UPI0025F826C9|nr:universal stress protein [Winogradskyella sp.]MCT4628902.1 universal stress protein [Winogradskyella sp.]
MKNVLLPTDFSENSWNAIKYAIHFFNSKTCNFYILHVNSLNSFIPQNESLTVDSYYLENTYTKPAKLELQSFLKRISKLKAHNNTHKFFVLTDVGFFIESIRKTVKEKKIDLIVMGTKGVSGFNKIILGTNTADVITKVKCNTLAVPENAEFVSPKEIAFPTDLNLSYKLNVLQPINEIIEHFKASLRLLHINKNKSALKNELKQNKALLEDYFSSTQLSFHYLTNKKVEDAVQCFVESRDIDLICMVAKNLNYFQQIFFHSRVEKISYHTDKPFLVLHEKN